MYSVFPYDEERLYEALVLKDRNGNAIRDLQLIRERDAKAEQLHIHLGEKGLEAESMIIEDSYYDKEFMDDYERFYSTCFKEYERHCRRIHFFTKPSGEIASLHESAAFQEFLFGSSESVSIQEYQKCYLGFIVVRPLPQTYIGRTMLRPWKSKAGRQCEYPAISTQAANIAGLELNVSALPFEEQDQAISTCATVALWSCLQQAKSVFDIGSVTQSSVTQKAQIVLEEARAIPSSGLTIPQMCVAIRAVGLEAEVFQLCPHTPNICRFPWLSLIYGYLSLGIPPIVAVKFPEDDSMHAISVCGVDYSKSSDIDFCEVSDRESIDTVAVTIQSLYAHDDQLGPYSSYSVGNGAASDRIGFSNKDVPVSPRITENVKKTRGRDLGNRVGRVVAIVVPVDPKIRLNFRHAYEAMYAISDLITTVLRIERKDVFEDFAVKEGDKGYVSDNDEKYMDESMIAENYKWRLRLLKSNTLKKLVREGKSSTSRRELILAKPQPKYIWYAELLYKNRVCLDIILDATDSCRSNFVMSWHWLNKKWKNDLKTELASQLDRGDEGKIMEHYAGKEWVDKFVSELLSN